MLRHVGIALTTLLAVLALTAAAASSAPAEPAGGSTVRTPGMWHAWSEPYWSGAHADVPNAPCAPTPFPTQSVVNGLDNPLPLSLYAGPGCAGLIMVVPPGTAVPMVAPPALFYSNP